VLLADELAADEPELSGAIPPVEFIPDPDRVSRLIDFPHKYDDARDLILAEVFMFPKSKGVYAGESVNWEKYCRDVNAIHALGCAWQKAKREKKPDMRYVGFSVAVVGDIRGIVTKRGHGFNVVHEPVEGIHHAEVSYAPSAELGVKFESLEREELKLALRQKFGPLVPHSCGD